MWSTHWSIQRHHMNLTIKQQQPTNHGSTLCTYPLVKQKCLIVHSWRQPHREYIETPNGWCKSLQWALESPLDFMIVNLGLNWLQIWHISAELFYFIFQNEFWQIIIDYSIFLTCIYIYIYDTDECTWTFFHSFLFTSIACYVSWLCLHVLFLGYTKIFVCLHKMVRSNHIINDVTTTNNCNSMALLEHHSNPCRACKKVKEIICDEGEFYYGYFAF